MALSPKRQVKFNEELEKEKHERNHNKDMLSMENRGDKAPFLRHCYKQQIELDTLEQARAKQTNNAVKAAQEQRTENFAYEMRKLNDEEYVDVKLRQQLRENCPELRDLSRKLNAAYANKIVHEQIKQKEARKLQDQIIELEQIEESKNAHITEKEHFKQLKEQQIHQQDQYKRDLQDQIIFQENARRTKYEEFLKEKKLIDELVLRIQEEEERELQLKYCAMLKTQEDIRKFKESQQLWREKARERLEKEDLAIQEFIKAKMEQSKKSAAEKVAREAARAQMVDDMAKKMYIEKRKQTEKEEILAELLEAEERESHERKHREKVEKELRMRLDIHRALNTQMEERLETMKQEAERDARYKEELIAQQAEYEKLELMTNEKRRIRMMQLRRDIEETLKAERLKKAINMQLLIKEQEQAKEEAEKRRLWIEDERVRMIKEHAQNLIGFLPNGIITDGEMNKLDDDLKFKLACNSNYKQCNW